MTSGADGAEESGTAGVASHTGSAGDPTLPDAAQDDPRQDESAAEAAGRPEGGEEPDAAGADADADAVEVSDADDEPVALPDQVRRRAAGFAAEALRALKPQQIPGPLRPAAQWHKGALPRAFADQLLAALDGEDGFRREIADELAERNEQARAVAGGEAGEDAPDPASSAALLYLMRPDGWRRGLRRAVAAMGEASPGADDAQRALQEVADLRARLDRLKQRHQRETAQIRQSESDTRARLTAAGDRLREQLSAASSANAAAAAELAESQREVATLQREVRRLRTQLEQARTASEQTRRNDRDARLAGNARVKVLLEVLQEAAAGLNGELSLPSTTGLPADSVEADAPSEPTPSKRLASAAELDGALTLPRCHLIVDGYNVSKGMWSNLPLQRQRERLISGLEAVASRTGAEVTVVFDGAEVGSVPAVTARGVRVRFSQAGEPADRVIVRLARAEPPGRPVVVVSGDAWLTEGARTAGARTADSACMAELLQRR